MSEVCDETVSHIRTILGDYNGKSSICLRWPRNKPCPFGDFSYYSLDIDNNCDGIILTYLSHQNIAGFNIEIETGINPVFGRFYEEDQPSVIKWLTVQIYVDGHLMDSHSARKRLLELNQLEFNNTASILVDGSCYWILVRISDIVTKADQEHFIRELPAYLAYLAIRWNLFDSSNNILFMISNETYWSELTMPLAGTINNSYVFSSINLHFMSNEIST
jgi:hypothetical protein